MKDETRAIFEELFSRYPALEPCRDDVVVAYAALEATCRARGTVFTCGNGGSASDSEHIVGELLKKFKKRRDIPAALRARLAAEGAEGAALADALEGSLAAVSLVSMTGILSAFANDVGWDAAFAQQLLGLARPGDALVALSTSGSSRNCVNAVLLARALGVRTIGLTGAGGGRLRALCDAAVCVPARETYQIQEFHLPVYHALCAMLESELFGAAGAVERSEA